jgi:hypothetical protein
MKKEIRVARRGGVLQLRICSRLVRIRCSSTNGCYSAMLVNKLENRKLKEFYSGARPRFCR